MFKKDTKILVCDDTISARRVVEFSLKKLGFTNIIQAEDGEEALEVYERELGSDNPVGLVICDWMMPNRTGPELLNKIRKDSPERLIPFIFITVKQEKKDADRIYAAGASAVLAKPFKSGELKTALEKAFEDSNAA